MPELLKTVLSRSATAVWLYNNGLARKARRAEFLKDQIRNVYGPVSSLFEAANVSFH